MSILIFPVNCATKHNTISKSSWNTSDAFSQPSDRGSMMIFPFLKRRKKTAEALNFKPTVINPPQTRPSPTRLRDATLVITHAEICDRHGTGALLGKILAHEQALLVL